MRLSDEEYVFYKDIQEKKSIGRGAFHKKNGSKSKKCNFPSDYMTKKEREAMNGEVMSYNPNAWYTWEEFKNLPMEYQVKYVNSLLNRYNCGLSNISEIVFGKSKGCLGIYFKKVGQMEFINRVTDRHLFRELYRNGEKLKADKEKTCKESQNGSETFVDDPVVEACPDLPYESPQTQIKNMAKEHIMDTAKYVDDLIAHGIQITATKMDEIYLERCGMTVAQAMKIMNPDKKEPEPTEKFTDVEAFSITMHELDQDVINYIRDLFGDKNIVVSIEVKEVKE